MSQIGPGSNPYGPQVGQSPSYPQPVVYRPGVAPVMGVPTAYGAADAYRPGMPPTGPTAVGPNGQPVQSKPYEYIAQKDVAFGIAGAIGGFFLAGLVGLSGPIGALILGLGLLAVSAVTRAIKHKSDEKQQQPVQGMPKPPVYPQAQMYQNQYNTQMTPQQGQAVDPRYRYPQ